MKLGELSGPFPFAFVVVRTDLSSELTPDWSTGQEQVAANDTEMLIKIQHEVDGPTIVRVWDDPTDQHSNFRLGNVTLVARTGKLRVSTADDRRYTSVAVPPGRLRIEVYGTAPTDADEIDLVVRPE